MSSSSSSLPSIPKLTISAVRQWLFGKQFTAVELAEADVNFAQAENPKTNAYLHFSAEHALDRARIVDQQIARGEDPGPLAGVPVAVKDVIVTKGEMSFPTRPFPDRAISKCPR